VVTLNEVKDLATVGAAASFGGGSQDFGMVWNKGTEADHYERQRIAENLSRLWDIQGIGGVK
jgi:hypothetical protein